MNSFNDTDVSLKFRLRVLVIGIGERVVEQLVPAGGEFGVLLTALFPDSQVYSPAFGNRNARLALECNDGAVPCGMSVAKWYDTIKRNVMPDVDVYHPMCRP